MTVKGTTQRPSGPINNATVNTPNIDRVTEILKETGTIDTNGVLYGNAFDEYTDLLKSGSIIRADVPEEFCGFVNKQLGETRTTSTDPYTSVLPAGTSAPATVQELPPTIPSEYLSTYSADRIISASGAYPGSPDYVNEELYSEDEVDPAFFSTEIEWDTISESVLAITEGATYEEVVDELQEMDEER